MTETNDTVTEAELKQQFDDLYMHIFKYIGDFVSIPTQKYNLTFEAFMVMDNVAHSKNGQTLVELAKLEGVSKSAIARQVNVLLKENYVMQKVDPKDRRVKYITLTAAGSRVQRNLSQATDERFHRWLTFFGGKEEGERFIKVLNQANERAIEAGFVGFDSLHDKRRNSNRSSH
ncbi:MarR family winged helix-turn-helix transcriptional regulator [Levilactobacillus tangyuanensis]|uniref:MarR family winged helix-turn-helix transcriptional regulator n=1 Tax=Levilactobacillus tangyuanensis TaxID=2486021 RepID=A0ABW1TLH9_9LACO|nr:MarR family transcriptional regulator [Levilactobacillus tangyuanensis]